MRRSSRSGAVRGISGPLPLEALGLRAAFGVTRASHSTTRNMCCPSLACGSSVRCSSALCCSAGARVCGFYAAACYYRVIGGQNTRVTGGPEVSKDPPTFSYSMTTAGAGLRPASMALVERAPTGGPSVARKRPWACSDPCTVARGRAAALAASSRLPAGADGPRVTRARRRPEPREETALGVLRSVSLEGSSGGFANADSGPRLLPEHTPY